jgi:hypothetical protein
MIGYGSYPLRIWHTPQPESGYVVDIHFHNSAEVLSIPMASARAANREAMSACEATATEEAPDAR